jgi:hypothetical protein
VTVYEKQEAAMQAGTLSPRDVIAVGLTRVEWANLLRRLRTAQPQMGRLAWMSIASIEAVIGEDQHGCKKENGGDADTGGFRAAGHGASG